MAAEVSLGVVLYRDVSVQNDLATAEERLVDVLSGRAKRRYAAQTRSAAKKKAEAKKKKAATIILLMRPNSDR